MLGGLTFGRVRRSPRAAVARRREGAAVAHGESAPDSLRGATNLDGRAADALDDARPTAGVATGDGTAAVPRALVALCERLYGASAARWFAPLLAPYRHAVLGLAALTLGAAAFGLAVPWLTKLVIDEALLAGDRGALLRYTLALLVVGAGALALGVVNTLLHLRCSVRLLNDLRLALVHHALGFSPRQHARLRTGETLSRIDGDAAELQRFAFDSLLGGGGAIVRLVGATALIVWLDWRLALLLLPLAPFELWFLARARPTTLERARELRALRGRHAASLAETLHGASALQTLDASAGRERELVSQQRGLAASLMRQRLWSEWVNAVPALAQAAARSAILLVGGFMVIDGELALGSLIAFLSYLAFMLGPMRTLLGIYHAQAAVSAAVARLDALLATPPAVREAEDALPIEAAATAELVARGLGPLPGGARVDARVEAGEKVLLRGPSGAGKTTLARWLARAEDAPEGEVRYAGVPLRRATLDSVRRRIVLVPQDGVLFHGSLAENLRLGDPTASEAALWRVLETVDLAGWAREAGGLERAIGEQARQVSGGQAQRIGIARALLRPFQVLILDEALSAVDGATRRAVMARIDARFAATTRIVIAHGAAEELGPFDRVLTLGPATAAGEDEGCQHA